MKTVFMFRSAGDDQGTISRLFCEEVGLDIRTIELPGRNNQPGLSRINAGEYVCIPYKSPKFGKCWLVVGTEGRSYVLFHRGNFAGDTKKGWRTDSHGCILPGKTPGTALYNGRRQKALFNSTSAFSEMIQKIGANNKFTLKIIQDVN